MKKTITALLLACAAAGSIGAATVPPYFDESLDIETRIDSLLPLLTTAEKIAMVHAQSKFSSPGVPRLGIPEFWMTDGPHGIRPEVLWDQWDQAGWTNDSCTAYPALTCLAATWNTDMARLYGRSIGEEARYRNKAVLLGPGVNIYRTPLNGRNFEYMGEDPLLAGKMAAAYVQGLQSCGVAACLKHFALNNQETRRYSTNVVVDERTLREIYLPAFRTAIDEGGAWAVMGAYNLYRDQWACHNQYLLNDILKGEWGFDGVVVSDWGGTHDTRQAIANGLDMEFGSYTDGLAEGQSAAYDNYYLARPYAALIADGSVGTAELDDKVRRILRLAFRTTLDSRRPHGSLATAAHFADARRIAGEGMVLLKNDGAILPLDSTARTILVVGENAIKMMTVGGGSSSLKAQHETSPLDGISRRAPGRTLYARGYVGDTSGEYNGVVSGQDLADSRSFDELADEACRMAADADAVIFVGGLNKSAGQDCEGDDRTSLDLPYRQNELIERLVEANPRLVVVNVSGNAVAMPWVDKVPAIIQAWYSGSEAGTALADIVFGDVNPSGKLPFTFPVALTDVAAHAVGEYPGLPQGVRDSVGPDTRRADVHYTEGIFTGYRYADSQKRKPLFPFGHGLSYTTFAYGQPTLSATTVTAADTLTVVVPVTNTGLRAGAETVQLYIADSKSSLPRPAKELKGFAKLHLQPGETATATFTVTAADLSYYDPERHAWVAEPGRFEAVVAASAADIKARLPFTLK